MKDVRKKLHGKIRSSDNTGARPISSTILPRTLEKPFFKDVFKKCIHVVRTIKNTALVRKILDKIFCEKHQRAYALPLYCKTRWWSVIYNAKQIIFLKSVVSFIPTHSFMTEKFIRSIILPYIKCVAVCSCR